MQLIKVGAAVLNQTPLAWDANQAHILAAIEQARQQNVSILCLPELCITGYGCEDAFLSPNTRRMAWQVLETIVPATKGMIVSVGLPLLHNNALYNTACLLVDGRIVGFTAKRFLAGDGIHYEPRWFKPWPAGRQAVYSDGAHEYPLGDIYFDCGGVKIGFEICEDAWVANRPGNALALEGVDIILNPSASHFAFGKTKVRERFVLEGSRAFGVSYIYTNLVGNEAGRAIYDGGAMIAAAGKMIAVGPRFSYADVSLTTAVIDIDATRMARAASSSFEPSLTEDPEDCVRVPFSFPRQGIEKRAIDSGDWETGSHVKEEEFTRAVSLALFDYLRKSRSQGFVVSISGGADSAAVSCLCAMLVKLAIQEIGVTALCEKLSYISAVRELASSASEQIDTAGASSENQIVRALLTTVYQATRNSSEVTRNAACDVATAIGADFLEFDIESIVQQYIATVQQALGRELSWKTDDVALQNIQARARSPGVWMLANVRSALLLSTSNRSEAAVGYATMDGDTSGGLSPIAGIDKAYLRRWLVWLEKHGPEGIGPIPALKSVNVQAPTAELRPSESKQTDEADLMPYELLDAIERAAIRDKQNPLEVYQHMQTQFSQHTAHQLHIWVERFFLLWCRNQWKRERYAPSFHLDDENLDPKTWCRFPILSGGFQRELAELRQYVQQLSE
ncbi:MAG: NAD(+) synthase [Planctomycetota bacterium]|nr:NAD(+) synthase [Planctomycetota bacterium]